MNACFSDCNKWHAHVHRAKTTFDSFSMTQSNPGFPFDKFEPNWNCRSRERIPALGGDGPKWICGLDLYDVTSTDYVLSLGSNGDTQFEDALHGRLPHMQIITIDPTLNEHAKNKVLKKKHIHFVDLAIGNETSTTIKRKMYKSMSFTQLHDKYNPSPIVKIDIEGSENIIFRERTSCDTLKGVDQVLIEIHGLQVEATFNWFSSCNFLLYSKEPNIWGCGGKHCGEYSFISPEFAYKDYIRSR